MNKYKRFIDVYADTEEMANTIGEAINYICLKVASKDIISISNEIKKDPGIIKKVIKIANNSFVKGLFKKSS